MTARKLAKPSTPARQILGLIRYLKEVGMEKIQPRFRAAVLILSQPNPNIEAARQAYYASFDLRRPCFRRAPENANELLLRDESRAGALLSEIARTEGGRWGLSPEMRRVYGNASFPDYPDGFSM